MHGSIVFEGISKTGKKYLIRYPQLGDEEEMCTYINSVSQEQTFISIQGEQYSLEEEKKFLLEQLKKMEEQKAVLLLVIENGHVIGVSGIELQERIVRHTGVLGISITKQYRNEGIGKQLMQSVLSEAEKNMPELFIITLSVFANNSVGLSLYEKLGFRVYGRLPKGIKHKGEYIDHVYMYKFVGKFAK